jgi:hypothetical protein
MGALIGLALGGPFGAVVGAALTPPMERLVKKSLAEFTRRGEVMAEAAAAASGLSEDEVTEVLVDDVELQPLLINIMDAAARTNNTQTLRAFGALLGEAVSTRPRRLDEQQLIVSALRDLGDPHVRVLEILEKLPVPESPTMGWTADLVVAAATDLTAGGAEAALSGLVRHGLVRSTSLWAAIGFELTSFGRAMLSVMRTAGRHGLA